MRRLAIAVVGAAIAALAAAGCSSTAKPKATAPPLPSSMTVTESSNGQVFTLQHPELKAGLVTFTLTSDENPNSFGSFDMQIFALKPGATQVEIKKAASVIQDEGFTTFDATLHGWGLLIEPPRVDIDAVLIRRPLNEFVVQEGMLLVIQPNVVTRDGKRGLQVGNLVEITATGARALQKFPLKFMRI